MTAQSCQCTLQLFPKVQIWDELCKYISHTRIILLEIKRDLYKWLIFKLFQSTKLIRNTILNLTHHRWCYGSSLLFVKTRQGLHTWSHLCCQKQRTDLENLLARNWAQRTITRYYRHPIHPGTDSVIITSGHFSQVKTVFWEAGFEAREQEHYDS